MKTVYPIRLFGRCSLTVLVAAMLLAACAGSAPPSASNARHTARGSVPDGYYRVQRGDNLYRIGLRFGQTVQTLSAWNGLQDPGQIEVGQLLRVRSGARVRPSVPHKTASKDKARQGSAAPSARPRTVSDSRLQWPVQGPLLSAYNGTTQKGIDIGGSRGTPIKAAAAGTVMYVGSEVRGYGNLVLIRHTPAMLTAYAHADSVTVRQGQQVAAGQTIARMGDSGTHGVKLHFEVRINGQAVNPATHLPH